MNLALYKCLTQFYLTNQHVNWILNRNKKFICSPFEVCIKISKSSWAWTTGLEEICIYVLLIALQVVRRSSPGSRPDLVKSLFPLKKLFYSLCWRVLLQFLFSIMEGWKINLQELRFKAWLNLYIIVTTCQTVTVRYRSDVRMYADDTYLCS